MKLFSSLILILASLAFSATAWSQSTGMDNDADPIDINIASEEELSAMLKNIGIKKASAIVKYRNTHGPFTSVDDLGKVSGIGPVTIEMNRARMTVRGGDRKNRPDMPGHPRSKADLANEDRHE